MRSVKGLSAPGAVRNRIKRQQSVSCSNSIQTGMSNSKRNLRRPANILGDRISVQRLIRNFWPGFARMLWPVKPDDRRARRERGGNFDSEFAYKPWWIAQHLVGPATYSKSSLSHGLDNYFVDRATREKKKSPVWNRWTSTWQSWAGCADRDSEFILRDALDQPGNAERNSAGCARPGVKAIPMRFGQVTAGCANRPLDRGAFCR